MSKHEVTAAELIAQLNADPEWVAARQRERAERDRRKAEWRVAETPLIDELRSAGYAVESAWDLVNTSEPYPSALPILLAHATRAYPAVVKEGIARALAVRDAKFGWPVLARQFREETEECAKDGLAVAIAAIADESLIGELAALVRDPANGSSRVLLLGGLERSSEPEARATLAEMKDDPDLNREVRAIEKRARRRRAT